MNRKARWFFFIVTVAVLAWFAMITIPGLFVMM